MRDILWKQPIASIEYLHAGGVGYVTDYFDAEKFQQDVLESNDCGEPICMVLYLDKNGNRLLQSSEWMESIDCPAVHLREEPAPPVQDRQSTYEIYQMLAIEHCPTYRFLPYKTARDQLSAQDYTRVYAAPLVPGTGLDELYELHNKDDRPAAQTMHSLSVSDVIVVRDKNSTKAFYVDSIGFKEVPQFVQMLNRLKKEKTKKNHPARRPPDSGLEL